MLSKVDGFKDMAHSCMLFFFFLRPNHSCMLVIYVGYLFIIINLYNYYKKKGKIYSIKFNISKWDLCYSPG